MGLTFRQKSIEQPLKNLLPYKLVSYMDINFTRDLEHKQLIMGYYIFLNGAVISWNSKKQIIVSTLTIEAK